ncbi:beta-ketoacyl synthase N-terminal-like domain-containing protein [Streptomyces griseocarneus]|uniref:beta-ketoacyl synthase N-terminal-like domain-containing protein n=1 Tax=Streptomyces griseocarneus TaxID=51201 RepID=UPI00167D4BEC|nr:beta-ketoacyl synthase N-terminal-like domain-containing protein [Streptomyces griseocarneus]MBZ6476174.1 beta-ketoacyl synthase [Streptomyces griseocarneus]GHG63582.1 hypothetical protein GCM10018779_33300 [Streptomyces griseocarneus]
MTCPSTTVLVAGTGVAIPGVPQGAGLLAAVRPPHPPLPWPPSGRDTRFKDRATRIALVAAEAALAEAGLLKDGSLTVPGTTVGTVVSSNLGNLDTVCRSADAAVRAGPAGLRVVDLPTACSNVVASSVAIRFGLNAVNLTLCNGATSGLDAVGWAVRALRSGRARRMVVVGVEPADPVPLHMVADQARAPGDRLLDGAAALVLETAQAAAGRGRPNSVTVTAYARRRDPAAAVRAVGAGKEAGLWLPPGHRADDGRPPHICAVCDMARTLPPASGALGVLQCVAAAAWLSVTPPPGTPPTALAVSGGAPEDDAAAAVLLSALSSMPRPGLPGPPRPHCEEAPPER